MPGHFDNLISNWFYPPFSIYCCKSEYIIYVSSSSTSIIWVCVEWSAALLQHYVCHPSSLASSTTPMEPDTIEQKNMKSLIHENQCTMYIVHVLYVYAQRTHILFYAQNLLQRTSECTAEWELRQRHRHRDEEIVKSYCECNMCLCVCVWVFSGKPLGSVWHPLFSSDSKFHIHYTFGCNRHARTHIRYCCTRTNANACKLTSVPLRSRENYNVSKIGNRR